MPGYPEYNSDEVTYGNFREIYTGDYDLIVQGAARINGVTLTGGGGGGGVADNEVTNAKLADVPTATLKGRSIAGTGDPTDLGTAAVKTMLSLNNVDNTSDANKPVSTAEQAALNLKADKTRTINSYGGTAVTAVIGDAGAYVRLTGSNPTYTIPTNAAVAFPVGTQIEGIGAASACTIAGPGVTIVKARTLVTVGTGSGWSLIKVATDAWDVHGDFV